MALCYIDIETAADEGVVVADPMPDARLTDPAKIEADRQKKFAIKQAKRSLDPWGARIVVLAWHRTGRDEEPIHVWPCPDEDTEREGLRLLLDDCRNATIVGHNVRDFDLPVIMARCLLLGVPFPYHWQGPRHLRYSDSIIDTLELANFYKPKFDEHVVSRSLTSMCRRFGIDIPDDDISGAWVAEAIAQGQWELVTEHCRRDVERTMALATKLRVADVKAATQREAVAS